MKCALKAGEVSFDDLSDGQLCSIALGRPVGDAELEARLRAMGSCSRSGLDKDAQFWAYFYPKWV